MAHDIFISYRRDGGEYTAKILRDRLTEAGYRVFFDVESLRSGDFNTKLYSVIDECTDFLLVLSPNALDRCVNDDDWVRREVEYALERGKNIVPVMLRGFSFPDSLPPSMEPLRFKNGLEANTQFFDAFLQQLTEKFLHTRPTFRRRLAQSTLLRRTFPLLLALLILVGMGMGIRAAVTGLNATYPRRAAEKNLTEEVLYYAECNLTAADMIGSAVTEFLDAGERYLSSSGDFENLKEEYDLRRGAVKRVNLSLTEASAGLIDRLSDSPFDAADVKALAPTTATMKEEWLKNLDYLLTILDPNHPFSAEEKLEVLDTYRTILSHELTYMASGCNHMLLPVTNEKALEEFFHVYLPELAVLPLSAGAWVEDGAALESSMVHALNRMESELMDLATRVGNTNQENAELEAGINDDYEALIARYMEKGHSREEAIALIEKALAQDALLLEVKVQYLMASGMDRSGATELLAAGSHLADDLMDALLQCWITNGFTRDEAVEIISSHLEDSLDLMADLASMRETLLPDEGDDGETLWVKMAYLLSYAFFDDARVCAAAYGTVESGSEAVTAALAAFIDLAERDGLLHGVMVTGYYEPDGINEILCPGDIIVQVNGNPCGSYTTYMELKSAIDGEYTATVLRLTPDGTWDALELTLSTEMPRVYLSTVVDDGTDE